MSRLYSYDYDSSFIPAMPAVEVSLGPAFAPTAVTARALVDSGADVTLIPQTMLLNVRARRGGRAWLRGITGDKKQVDLYFVSLTLASLSQASLEIVGDRESETMIIGRDILNQLTVVLNGPGGAVQIWDEPP